MGGKSCWWDISSSICLRSVSCCIASSMVVLYALHTMQYVWRPFVRVPTARAYGMKKTRQSIVAWSVCDVSQSECTAGNIRADRVRLDMSKIQHHRPSFEFYRDFERNFLSRTPKPASGPKTSLTGCEQPIDPLRSSSLLLSLQYLTNFVFSQWVGQWANI